MRLSKNFWLSEMIKSNTAIRYGIPNVPSTEEVVALTALTISCLQPIRDNHGVVSISSGFRSGQLSEKVNSSRRSQHCKGEALDLQFWKDGQMCNKEIYDWIIDNAIEFDQMINEFDYAWIHISLKENKNRKQVLEAYKDDDGDTAYRVADTNQTTL